MPDMFGQEPSQPAKAAATLFAQNEAKTILELGSGQGRDTLFFAHNGFQVTALDYAETGVKTIEAKAKHFSMADNITAMQHDVRQPLPCKDASFDACFSHMLYCMALTTDELKKLTGEVHRVLRSGGLHVYTVRHTGDAHYRQGNHHGEDMYETGGYVVHFFDKAKVELLAEGFELLSIDEFEEGPLPRKLFQVTLRKL